MYIRKLRYVQLYSSWLFFSYVPLCRQSGSLQRGRVWLGKWKDQLVRAEGNQVNVNPIAYTTYMQCCIILLDSWASPTCLCSKLTVMKTWLRSQDSVSLCNFTVGENCCGGKEGWPMGLYKYVCSTMYPQSGRDCVLGPTALWTGQL